MKRIFIRPLDTQFYRDGRPFEAGVETEGFSLFPPFPRTIYGAFRSLILGHSEKINWGKAWNDLKLINVVGTPISFGSLTIRGPLIARKKYLPDEIIVYETIYPPPFDLLKIKDEKEYILIKPQENKSLSDFTNLSTPKLLPCSSNNLYLEEVNDYLNKDDLWQYLTGDPPQLLEEKSKIFQPEHKVGIALDRNLRTAKTGFLYAIPQIRMENTPTTQGGQIVEIDGDDNFLPDSGFLRLGGDSRPAEFEIIPPENREDMKEKIKEKIKGDNGRFKSYLITPALFENGWYPDFLSQSQNGLIGKLPGTSLEVKLVGACIGRSIPIGGFDIFKGYPKSILRAVPPGSVYFFELLNFKDEEDKKVNELIEKFFFLPLADCSNPNGVWKEGFNLVLIGGW